MSFPTFALLFGLILIVSCVTFFFRNYFMNVAESSSSIKNLVFCLLCIISLMSSLAATAGSWDVAGVRDMLLEAKGNSTSFTSTYIVMLQQRYDAAIWKVEIAFIVCLTAFISAYFIMRSIRNENKRVREGSKNRWDWDKIRSFKELKSK